jgi:hypothetical protein
MIFGSSFTDIKSDIIKTLRETVRSLIQAAQEMLSW